MNVCREIAALKENTGRALARSFEAEGFAGLCEAALARRWQGLLDSPDIYEEGWYVPPPAGIISNFAKEQDNFDRARQPSFRPEFMWPREDIFYEESDIVLLYASPVQRNTGLIGDFGMSLYRGGNKEIHDHLDHVMRVTTHIARQARSGMMFQELYALAMEVIAAQGFHNSIASSTDAAGTNIGHTIPLSYGSDPTHAAVQKAGSFDDIREALRTGRKFISAREEQRIEDTMAFTVEPRLSTDKVPDCWFHLTVIFDRGEPRIVHGFEPVFQVFGLQRLLACGL